MRPCATPGCSKLVKRGKCERCHGKTQSVREERLTACRRGYDRTWQRFRDWFLRRHPLCHDCEGRGDVVPAAEVHHIKKLADHPELRCVESNCMALCKACHSKRTGRGE